MLSEHAATLGRGTAVMLALASCQLCPYMAGAVQAGENALVMPVSLHTFLVGQPLALPHLRRVLQYITEHLKDVWVTTPGEVFNHVKALPSGTVPGDGQFQKSHSYLQSK